jgi:hypothetical protein
MLRLKHTYLILKPKYNKAYEIALLRVCLYIHPSPQMPEPIFMNLVVYVMETKRISTAYCYQNIRRQILHSEHFKSHIHGHTVKSLFADFDSTHET